MLVLKDFLISFCRNSAELTSMRWRFTQRNIIFNCLEDNSNQGFEMTKSYPAILILILLLTGTAASQSMGELGSYTTGSGLMGQVVDASGSGISGAGIWIIGGEGQAINTATNATGYYSMNVPPGNYTITAELSGYSFTSSAMQVQTGTLAIAPRITGYDVSAMPTTPIAPAATAGFDQVRTAVHHGRCGMGPGQSSGSERCRHTLCKHYRRRFHDIRRYR